MGSSSKELDCFWDRESALELYRDKNVQHTSKLGQYKRSLESREGSNIYALWGAKDNTVAVLVRLRWLKKGSCFVCRERYICNSTRTPNTIGAVHKNRSKLGFLI